MKLTVSALLEVIPERLVDTPAIESVPHIRIPLAAKLCPLEYDLHEHVRVHGYDTEPQELPMPAFGLAETK